MLAYLRTLIIRNMISPLGLALFSSGIFLLAWVFPPDIYTYYMHEPDYVFLDLETLIYFASCVLMFLLGSKASSLLGALPDYGVPINKVVTSTPIMFLGIPIIATTIPSIIYLVQMGGKINLLALIMSQQGEEIKYALSAGQLDVGGKWHMAPLALTAVLWWSFYRSGELKLEGSRKWGFRLMFLTGLAVDLYAYIATVDRTSLMPLLLGLMAVSIYKKSRASQVSLRKMLGPLIGGVTGVGATFAALQFLRGARAFDIFVTSMMGYSIAPYNRLKVLLDGDMHYLNEGTGQYLAPYLLGEGFIPRTLGFKVFFGWPDQVTQWRSEFSANALAGLNPGYIWAGVFGYIYSDIGWWTLLYMFLAGILIGYLWWMFRSGRAIGVVWYPWAAFWVFFWVGSNQLFSGVAVIILETGILLTAYEHLSIRKIYDIGGLRGGVKSTAIR